MISILAFSVKYNFLSLFTWIRVKTDFSLYCPVINFAKIIVQIICGYVQHHELQKREVSSANSLAFVIKSSERSLIQIKNNDPSIDPSGTPALVLVDEENYPFKTTFVSWSLKNL